MLNALFCVLSVLLGVTSIKDCYRKKAKMTTEVLNSMENVKCNEVAGAMYAFPRITPVSYTHLTLPTKRIV